MCKNEIVLSRDFQTQFGDTDADGLVGIRGYLTYFQNAVTEYMLQLGLDGFTLFEKYGAAWVYTKYKLHINKKASFGSVHINSWTEKRRSVSSLLQNLEIIQENEMCAYGKLEFCLYGFKNQRLCRISDINYPFSSQVENSVAVTPFTRIGSTEDNGKYIYTHIVRYTDLDSNLHMNNIKYVDMILNAFDSKFYNSYSISDFEIHYMNQSYEGEKINVYVKQTENRILLTGEKEDGTAAVKCIIIGQSKDMPTL